MSAEVSLIMLLLAIALFPILFCLISDRYLRRQTSELELKEIKPKQSQVLPRHGLLSQINERSFRPEQKIRSAYAAHQHIEQHDMRYEHNPH